MARETLVQDEKELRKWFEEGRSYRWMADEYMMKYNLQVSPSMFGNIRRRWGYQRRAIRNDDLIPWAMKREHMYHADLANLRSEARLREGYPLSEAQQIRLDNWKAALANEGAVVHYDPDTEEGFWWVPRREGIDHDLIRQPERKTTKYRRSDD